MTNADLFKYMKLFEDELTLDNLSMSQLRALCRMLGVQPLGTPEILRFQLKLKLRDLKADDRVRTVIKAFKHLIGFSANRSRRRCGRLVGC